MTKHADDYTSSGMIWPSRIELQKKKKNKKWDPYFVDYVLVFPLYLVALCVHAIFQFCRNKSFYFIIVYQF